MKHSPPKYYEAPTDITRATRLRRIRCGWYIKGGLWHRPCKGCKVSWPANSDHFYFSSKGYQIHAGRCKHCASFSGKPKTDRAEYAIDYILKRAAWCKEATSDEQSIYRNLSTEMALEELKGKE